MFRGPTWIRRSLLLLIGAYLALTPGAGLAEVRLAILSDGETAAAADLLTAELSKTEGIVLVEREELARVAREQELTATAGAVRLGRLLRADGVALPVPGRPGGKDPGTLRMLAVGPGVGVADVPLPAAGVDPLVWSRLAAGRLSRVLPKLGVKANETVPVSLLGLRAALRPEFKAEPLERELSLALAARLRGAPEVFVLERQRLDALGAERELAPAPEETPFWTGGFLLDGTIDRDNLDPARLTLDVFLRTREASAPPISLHVEGARDAGPALVEELAGKILAAIGRSPTPPAGWDALAEAAEFEVEGHWAARWNQWPEAEAAFQSAWALGDRHRALAVALIEVLARHADPRRKADAAPVSPLAVAHRALALYQDRTGEWGLPAYRLDPAWYALGCRVLEAASERLKTAADDTTFRRAHVQELAGLRREVREAAAMLRSANLVNSPEPLSAPRPAEAPGPPVDDEPEGRSKPTPGTVDTLQARYAPFWNDGPEGAIAVYRALFTGGRVAAPADANRIRRGLLCRAFPSDGLTERGDQLGVWEEGLNSKDLHSRWDGFIAELCASRQPSAPFYGQLLAFRRMEGDVDRISAAERLLETLWQERSRVFSGEADFDCLYCALSVVSEFGSHYSTPVTREFLRGPLKSFRLRILPEFLAHHPGNGERDAEDLLGLLPSTFETNNYYTPAEADHLRELAARFPGTQLPWKLTLYLQNLPRDPGPAATTAPATPPPFVPPVPDPRCLRVTRRFVPVPQGHIVGLRAGDDGRIWADVRGRTPSGSPTGSACLVGTDPATGRTEVISREGDHFGEESYRDWGGFDLVGDVPFISRRDGVYRYHRAATRWEKLPLPASYARLWHAGNRLLLSTGDSILRYDPATGQAEVLASARRRPALNALDAAGEFNFPTLHLVLGGGVQTVVGGRTFLLDPVTNQWRDEGRRPNPTGGMPYSPRAYGADAYTLLRGSEDEDRLPWVLGPPERREDARANGRILGEPPANRFHAALRYQAPRPEIGEHDYLRSRPGDLWLWFEDVDPDGHDDPNHRFPPFSLGTSRAQLVTTDTGLGITDEGQSAFWFIPNSELDAHFHR